MEARAQPPKPSKHTSHASDGGTLQTSSCTCATIMSVCCRSWCQEDFLFGGLTTPPVSPADGLLLEEHASFLPAEDSFDLDDGEVRAITASKTKIQVAVLPASKVPAVWTAWGPGGLPLTRQHSHGAPLPPLLSAVPPCSTRACVPRSQSCRPLSTRPSTRWTQH